MIFSRAKKFAILGFNLQIVIGETEDIPQLIDQGNMNTQGIVPIDGLVGDFHFEIGFDLIGGHRFDDRDLVVLISAEGDATPLIAPGAVHFFDHEDFARQMGEFGIGFVKGDFLAAIHLNRHIVAVREDIEGDDPAVIPLAKSPIGDRL